MIDTIIIILVIGFSIWFAVKYTNKQLSEINKSIKTYDNDSFRIERLKLDVLQSISSSLRRKEQEKPSIELDTLIQMQIKRIEDADKIMGMTEYGTDLYTEAYTAKAFALSELLPLLKDKNIAHTHYIS